MRNAFLALVLANLVFAAWHHWFATPEAAFRFDDDLPSIMLVSELEELRVTPAPAIDVDLAADNEAEIDAAATEPELAADVAESPAAAATAPAEPRQAPPPSDTRCVSVGPFRELSQAANAAANLRAGGYAPTQRAGEGDIWVGYWVYLEQIPTKAEADEIVARLRANGVGDAYVIPGSDNGNLVSLGVFTEIARAGGRREAARSLGLEPVISDRTRRGTVYWVDVLLAAGQSLDFELLQSPGRISRLEQRSCERAPA